MNVTVVAITNYINFNTSMPTLVLSPITFTDSSPETTSNWAWILGDGTTSLLHNPINTYNGAGQYSVTFTANTSVGRLNITKIVDVIYASATADFTWSPINSSIYADVTVVEFTPLVTPNNPYYLPTYLWDFGEGGSSGDSNPTHIFTVSGTYTVTLIFSITVNGNVLTDTKTHTIVVVNSAIVAKSTTIIIPRNISNTLDLRTLTNNVSGLTYLLSPDEPNPNVKIDLVNPYNFTYTPSENFLGMFSYRYHVIDSNNISAFGKITYIVREPKIELLVGTQNDGYSVVSNKFGSYDISFNSIEIGSELTLPLIVLNIGEADLYINTITLVDNESQMFTLQNINSVNIINTDPIVLSITDTFEFKIKFFPSSIGRKTCRIKIKHN